MGLPVLVLGQSGTGKSASLRNFDQKKIGVVNIAGKPLPFKNKIECVTTDDYSRVKNAIKGFIGNGKKTVVVDDAQYLMGNEFMRRAMERGFDKFTEIGRNFWDLINTVKELPDDAIVYFFAHTERDAEGNEKIKTIGKLLDEKITVEGMFTIVLKTNVTDGQYSFLTQNNGHDTTKSPIGMFPTYAIDNDLNYVDEKIRNYYEIGEFLSDEDIAEIDKAAAKVDFKPKQEGEKKSRRSRRGDEKEEKSTETPKEEKKEEATERTARRRRTSDNDNDTKSDESSSVDANEENANSEESSNDVHTGRKRRRVSDSMAEERQAVEKENAKAIANAGMEEAGDNEEVDYDDVKEPDLKELPRRKKRGEANDEPAMNPPADEAQEPTTRRRRRR